jgi:ADP-ribose pyrophosphatase YjhB (NUDIX family)
MSKVKCSVASYLLNPRNEKEFLVIKRPSDDDVLPNLWGLPAVTLKRGELPEQAVARIGIEKLNTIIEPVSFLVIKSTERKDYELILMDIKTRLVGPEPMVANAKTKNTKYVDQKWTSDLNLLKKSASKGSLCSQILLDVNNIQY